MASVDFITKRIAGKEKELEKLTKKMERIRKAEATNWEVNPYYYSEYDIRSTTRDIEDAQKALDNYKAQLVAETEKNNSRNVTVILNFLESWKARVRFYYVSGLTDYYEEKQAIKELYSKITQYAYSEDRKSAEQIAYEEANKQFRTKCIGVFETEHFTNRWGRQDKREVKVKDGEYEYLKAYTVESTLEGAISRLEKDLVQEANRKYDFIIERTNSIVGTITDASNLKIGAKDDLNGYIIGERGTAKVKTIGAGGYNIQCFHFRTLITAMK
jgi:cell division septum initiation protein DivIVA